MPDLTLGFITDIHFGVDTLFQGKLRKLCHRAPALTRDFISRMNDEVHPDFVVNLGDDIEDQGHPQDVALYGACQAELRRSLSPVINVAGNHDQVHLTADDLNRFWQRSGPLYYSLDHGDWHFVVMHTVETPGVDIRIDPAQLEWLRKDLRDSRRPTLVFMHHSASEQDLEDSRWFRGCAHIALVRERGEFRSILEDSKTVRAVFNGHLHRNHLDVIRGIPYVTIQSPIENLEDDAPGIASGAYAVVRANEQRIVVRVKGNDPARYQFETS